MSELNLTHSNGNKVKLTTPDTLAANKPFKLPGADGTSGQFLKTDGSGALSFATVATNTSNVKVTRTSISNISGVSYYDATLPANCFKVEFSGMNLSSSGNSYPIFRVGTSSGIMSGGSDYKFCQNKIGASTAGTFETNSLIYTSGYIAGSSGDVHTTQATFMKCGTGERWTYTSITMEEGNASSQVTVAHPQNGSNALTTIRYLTHDGSNFDSGEISWTCWSTT